jgi:hypothetical protein
LEQEHPEVRHEVPSHAVIRVIEQYFHFCFLGPLWCKQTQRTHERDESDADKTNELELFKKVSPMLGRKL